jgi:hypothetical protein
MAWGTSLPVWDGVEQLIGCGAQHADQSSGFLVLLVGKDNRGAGLKEHKTEEPGVSTRKGGSSSSIRWHQAILR